VIRTLVASCCLLVACSRPSAPQPAPAPVAPLVLVAAPEEDAAAPVPEVDKLAAYTLDAMLDAIAIAYQVRAGEPEDAARARYAEIASQIAEAARADGARAFPGAAPGVAAAHLALVLVAIGAHETGFLLQLDGDNGELQASDAGAREKTPCPAHVGGCDGGWAHGLWQVHARPGHDRAYYLKLASARAAGSLRDTGGMCGYSGSCKETGGGTWEESQATKDIESAYRTRWAAHPWRAP
jgi:hypothetical protein